MVEKGKKEWVKQGEKLKETKMRRVCGIANQSMCSCDSSCFFVGIWTWGILSVLSYANQTPPERQLTMFRFISSLFDDYLS